MSLHDLLRAFVTVFPAELPDKTMVASIVLVARFRRPLFVWLGAITAFLVHVTVATAAGSAIGLLPDVVVKLAVAALFLTGSILLFRAGRAADGEAEDDVDLGPVGTPWSTIVGSFTVIVLAEWGDLTQLATASLAADSQHPVSIAIGAWVALACVAGIAATFGRQLVARVPIHRVNYIGAAVFFGLAIWTLVELVA